MSYSLVMKQVVIVGGGPVGLGAAEMLRRRGWNDIVVLERRLEASFESEKAYLYLLDGRGQRCTDPINITHDISQKSVASDVGFQYLNEILTTGELKRKKVPARIQGDIRKFWIPRSTLLDIQLKHLKTNNGDESKIQLKFGCSFESIRRDTNGSLVLQARDVSGDSISYTPDLIIGCDGMNSRVRHWLEGESDGEAGGDMSFTLTKLLKKLKEEM